MSLFKLNKFYLHITLLFLVLVFSFPRVMQELKMLLLGTLVLLFLLLKLKVSKQVFVIAIIYLIILLPFLAIAGINGNEKAYVIVSLRIYYFFPAVLMMLFYTISNNKFKLIIYKASLISIVIITIVSLSTLLKGLGYFPINLNAIFYEDEDRIGLNDGYVHIINSPLSYYIFLVPIVFNNGDEFKLRSRKFYFFIFLLFFSVITGRRILLLPFILVLIFHFRQFYKQLLLLFGVIVIFLSYKEFENFNPQIILSRFEDAINSKGDSAVREEQAIYFRNYIKERPLLGYGLGAYMPDYLRNEDFKMAYEKSYYYLIFVMGYVGASVLTVFYIYLFRRSYLLNKKDNINIGILLGTLSLLIASSTNPYWLSSFDYSIPFAVLLYLSQKRNVV